jgi:hypothetical protein
LRTPTLKTADMGLFQSLKLNFCSSTTLGEKIENVNLELDGVYRYLDLTASNKVYEKVTQADDSTTTKPDNMTRSLTKVQVARPLASVTTWKVYYLEANIAFFIIYPYNSGMRYNYAGVTPYIITPLPTHSLASLS